MMSITPQVAPHGDPDVILQRNNVVRSGRPGGPPLLFAHGFGCDQTMWRFVTPAFEATHDVIVFDYVGCGGSDLGAYDRDRYATLDGYATDVLDVCRALDLEDVVFVGHSVSATIGVLAANREPERFAKLVLLGPSPRYVDAPGYTGGFSAEDVDELLLSIERNWAAWAVAMAPVIAGPTGGAELTAAFCRTDPDIARQFARATFLADNRADLARLSVPALVLQCSADAIAPESVGRFVHAQLPFGELRLLEATGHCPQLTAPAETIEAIRGFL